MFSTFYGSLQLSIVAIITYFLMFTRWVNTMVDMVANKILDAYSRLKPGDDVRSDTLTALTSLRRTGGDSQLRKIAESIQEKEQSEKLLFELKESSVNISNTNQRPLMGLCCFNCCPESRESLVTKTTESLSLVNLFNQETFLKSNGFLQRTFCHLQQVYTLRKYDYPRVEEIVLRDERLKQAVEKTALEQFHDLRSEDENVYRKLIKNNEKRAHKLLYDMRSTLSDFLLRFTSWVLYKLLPMFLNSVIVHPGQIEMIKKANESGLPLIFIPLHKSHLDYIMVSFILLNNNIRSPLVAGGDNLRIPFFGSLLRGLGAFFIKRRIDPIMGRKDHVYKAVLHTYMNECLRSGHNIEFFLEGGRTRTGKPCMPKYGIFSVIVDAFMDGTIEDALLVPISMNYEKLIDGNFVREQLGEPKEMETFGLALRSIWKILNSSYGMVRVNFYQPFSLRELIKTFNVSGKIQPTNGMREKPMRSRPSTTSLYGTDIVSDEHKQLVQSISKHVLYECATSTAIMSTNAVAFLLLNKFRNGATVTELTRAMDQLRLELLRDNTDVGFSGDPLDVVEYAISLLGPSLVRTEITDSQELIKPVSILPNVIELSYYSNCLMQYYALKSVIATALSVIDLSSGFVSESELIQTTLDLCDILQFEFVFCKPCQKKEVAILNTIDDLMFRGEIFEKNKSGLARGRRRIYTADVKDDDENNEKTVQYKLGEDNLELLQFLRRLLKPWLEPYCVSAQILEKLVDETMLEEQLTKEILAELKNQLYLGTVTYGESVCVDPIKNSLKLFQKWEILDCHTEEKVRLLYLRDQYDNSESVLNLYERINKYRSVL